MSRKIARYILILIGLAMAAQVFYLGWGTITGWGIFAAPDFGSLHNALGLMNMAWGGICFVFLVISGCSPLILKRSKMLQWVSILFCFSLFLVDVVATLSMSTSNLRILFGGILFSVLFSSVVVFGVASAWISFFEGNNKE